MKKEQSGNEKTDVDVCRQSNVTLIWNYKWEHDIIAV